VPAAERPDLRWLAISSLVETVSLIVLLVNLATAHVPQVASATGPVHGFAYLATIATAFLLPLGTRTRLLTLIPAIGGLLALSRARRPPSDARTRACSARVTVGRDKRQELSGRPAPAGVDPAGDRCSTTEMRSVHDDDKPV
jgi:hypothetical protein